VVRFDLPGTAREFIQSRGRGRAPASHMVLLAEEGNTVHAALIEDARRCAPRAPRAPAAAPRPLSGPLRWGAPARALGRAGTAVIRGRVTSGMVRQRDCA